MPDDTSVSAPDALPDAGHRVGHLGHEAVEGRAEPAELVLAGSRRRGRSGRRRRRRSPPAGRCRASSGRDDRCAPRTGATRASQEQGHQGADQDRRPQRVGLGEDRALGDLDEHRPDLALADGDRSRHDHHGAVLAVDRALHGLAAAQTASAGGRRPPPAERSRPRRRPGCWPRRRRRWTPAPRDRRRTGWIASAICSETSARGTSTPATPTTCAADPHGSGQRRHQDLFAGHLVRVGLEGDRRAAVAGEEVVVAGALASVVVDQRGHRDGRAVAEPVGDVATRGVAAPRRRRAPASWPSKESGSKADQTPSSVGSAVEHLAFDAVGDEPVALTVRAAMDAERLGQVLRRGALTRDAGLELLGLGATARLRGVPETVLAAPGSWSASR